MGGVWADIECVDSGNGAEPGGVCGVLENAGDSLDNDKFDANIDSFYAHAGIAANEY